MFIGNSQFNLQFWNTDKSENKLNNHSVFYVSDSENVLSFLKYWPGDFFLLFDRRHTELFCFQICSMCDFSRMNAYLFWEGI